jgi:MFS family permease
MNNRRRYETTLIAVLCLMFGFVFFDRNAMSYLGPYVREELGLTFEQLGSLSSGLSFAWAIAGLLVGYFSDRTGQRKSILLTTVVIFSLCSALSGMATSFAVLLASRMLMGLAEGGILPVSQSLIALEVDEKRRGLSMGVMQNLGSNLIGSAVAPLVLGALAAQYGWRMAFYIAAVPGLICTFLIWKYVREPKQEEIQHAAATAPPAGRMTVLQMLGYRNMWLCILMSCFMVAWMVLGWVFLPNVYKEMLHLSAGTSAVLMSMLGVSAAVFAFIVPGLSDKLGRKPVMIVFTAIGVIYPLVGERRVSALHGDGALGDHPGEIRRDLARARHGDRRSGRRHDEPVARRQTLRSVWPAGLDVHGAHLRRRRYGDCAVPERDGPGESRGPHSRTRTCERLNRIRSESPPIRASNA